MKEREAFYIFYSVDIFFSFFFFRIVRGAYILLVWDDELCYASLSLWQNILISISSTQLSVRR